MKLFDELRNARFIAIARRVPADRIISWMRKFGVQAASWRIAALETGPEGLWKLTGTWFASHIAATFFEVRSPMLWKMSGCAISTQFFLRTSFHAYIP